MEYGIRHICEIVEGEFLQFHGDDPVEHLLLDSRRLIFPGTSLFFSLKGPRRDGQHYMGDLYQRGVRNFVVQERLPEVVAGSKTGSPATPSTASAFPDANIILVKDSLAALQQLAAHHRRQFHIPVIGITGSNGKTIVKEWLNQLLEDEYHIVRSPKSYNSQIGVPLSVWQMNDAHELAIFEAGISRMEEMSRLETIIEPTIGIFTNIGEAHNEGFQSLAEKAEEKLKLFHHASVIIYCLDQPETVKALEKHRLAAPDLPGTVNNPGNGLITQFFSWGRDQTAILVILGIEKKDGVTTVVTTYKDGEFIFAIPFTDEASFENIMHCVCVLLYLGKPMDYIRSKLLGLAPIAMRLELKSGINHCSIINDSYSADLSSLQIALDFLAQQRQHERRTVILSDFLESGRDEDKLYNEIARALELKKIDRLVAIGGKISAHHSTIKRYYSGEAIFFPSVEQFKKDFFSLHFREETILLKGARIFEFEEIDRMLSGQIHQTMLEINLNAMAYNLRQYRQQLAPSTKVMAMVKAFAYGSGSYEIANLLQFHRVDYLGVAYADEGVALRKGGISMPVMVMNTENSSFDALVQYNLEPVIYSFSLLRSFDKWLKKEGILQFPVHIELETGMNRLGFSLVKEPQEELLQELKGAAFKVQSVFSHLAASEEAQQDEFTHRQGADFLAAADRLQEILPYPFLRHIANSAAIIRHPQLQLDMVRLGIGLYGIDSAVSGVMDLQEVSTLKSTIAQIKYLLEGDTVGYNRRGIASPGTVIATVRIGYADGYSRSLGNGVGKMWVKGRLAPVIGSVCMDMTMIDITGIPDLKEGDEVIIFGNELSVSQLSQWAKTIPYEILTGVSQRVKRIYFEE
ncbi:bifunctional UDP-N-acetylmuramoyl-tripeptide:D-alanyl-D-alanine ligase/alanine racemase [Flavitalea flava]